MSNGFGRESAIKQQRCLVSVNIIFRKSRPSTNSTVTAPGDYLGQPCMWTIMLGRSLFIKLFAKRIGCTVIKRLQCANMMIWMQQLWTIMIIMIKTFLFYDVSGVLTMFKRSHMVGP